MTELRCYAALSELGLTLEQGETALDAVLRHLAAVDPLVRPYRYPQTDGMRGAFQVWFQTWPQRHAHILPGGYVSDDTLQAYEAGYAAGGKR